jgi:hypothetical protein
MIALVFRRFAIKVTDGSGRADPFLRWRQLDYPPFSILSAHTNLIKLTPVRMLPVKVLR